MYPGLFNGKILVCFDCWSDAIRSLKSILVIWLHNFKTLLFTTPNYKQELQNTELQSGKIFSSGVTKPSFQDQTIDVFSETVGFYWACFWNLYYVLSGYKLGVVSDGSGFFGGI